MDPSQRKICSIGINVSRRITAHGFAFNVDSDLRYFELIRPCGMDGASMTSLAELLGRPVSPEMLAPDWIRLFSEVFALRWEIGKGFPLKEAAIA